VLAPAPVPAYSPFGAVFSGSFEITGLRADTYQIIVKDGNDCSSMANPLEVSVGSTNPLIQISSVVQNVKCFGESNGSISITPVAGFVVNSYQWTGRTETTSNLTGLPIGSYEVEITYSGSCKEKFSFNITQPVVLGASSSNTIACDRLNDGKITLNATGGTLPYSYSINNGSTWTTDTTVGGLSNKIFTNLAPGVYEPKVKDANNCTKSLASITIVERGDDPRPRFLVATRQNALDTLVLINTSYPNPTSTVWTLDPRATVISQSTEEARVKFPVAGNYSVTMNATFNGCSYLITKDLVISDFDPNDPGTVVGIRPIQTATVVPNPNDGNFTLNVVLTKKQYVRVMIIDAMGTIRYQDNKNTDRTLGFSESISLPTDMGSGLYILRVVTDNDAQEVRFTLTR
jgi:large repetitive protein